MTTATICSECPKDDESKEILKLKWKELNLQSFLKVAESNETLRKQCFNLFAAINLFGCPEKPKNFPESAFAEIKEFCGKYSSESEKLCEIDGMFLDSQYIYFQSLLLPSKIHFLRFLESQIAIDCEKDCCQILRFVYLVQNQFPHLSSTLKSLLVECQQFFESKCSSFTIVENSRILILLNNCQLVFGQQKVAEKTLNSLLRDYLKIEIDFEGLEANSFRHSERFYPILKMYSRTLDDVSSSTINLEDLISLDVDNLCPEQLPNPEFPIIVEGNSEYYRKNVEIRGESQANIDSPTKITNILASLLLNRNIKTQQLCSINRYYVKTICDYVLDSSPQHWPSAIHLLHYRHLIDIDNPHCFERAYEQIEQLKCIANLLDFNAQNLETIVNGACSCGCKSLHQYELESARILQKNGQLKTAIEIYKKYDKYEDLINCFGSIGFKNEALKIVNEKLQNNPKNRSLQLHLAKLNEDVELMKEIWSNSDRRYLDACLSIASYYYCRKNFVDALQFYDCCSLLNRLDPNIYFPKACCEFELKKYDEAEISFLICINQECRFVKIALENLSQLYMTQSYFQKAKQTLKQLLDSKPSSFYRIQLTYLECLLSIGSSELPESCLTMNCLIDWNRKQSSSKFNFMPFFGTIFKQIENLSLEFLPDLSNENNRNLARNLLNIFNNFSILIKNIADSCQTNLIFWTINLQFAAIVVGKSFILCESMEFEQPDLLISIFSKLRNLNELFRQINSALNCSQFDANLKNFEFLQQFWIISNKSIEDIQNQLQNLLKIFPEHEAYKTTINNWIEFDFNGNLLKEFQESFEEKISNFLSVSDRNLRNEVKIFKTKVFAQKSSGNN
ncbi:MAG: Tetratricopeptide repeat domain 27 [Marteilia pararefringens]